MADANELTSEDIDALTEVAADELETHAFKAFRALGFDPLEALALVANRVSPSAVRELVRHGADPRTAVSILL